MSGVNKAIILGNLGNDPEIKYSAAGKAVANITVATSESWKDKNSGEKVEKTEWHRISAFGRLAEIMGEYLKKGSKVYIEGRIETSKYQKDGQDHYSTSIIASTMQMLDSRGANNPAEHHSGAVEQKNPTYAPSQPVLDDSDIPFDFYERKSVV